MAGISNKTPFLTIYPNKIYISKSTRELMHLSTEGSCYLRLGYDVVRKVIGVAVMEEESTNETTFKLNLKSGYCPSKRYLDKFGINYSSKYRFIGEANGSYSFQEID
ncbi:hypothetical protein [Thermoactinomyces sp. DSM 45892]|uniref:hypothetical protein n=1 Tax=Thermoactinomyces sp. DSM 45892 TaxID=1882753 RepID=UPI00089D9B7C|nr:hypothetical protein [Thermoactinomyces sp. DSM 45892]SDZ06199.1 hypothetical protein SAMN05444416_112125 [Thermoactinomyces sp. DSM 45892]